MTDNSSGTGGFYVRSGGTFTLTDGVLSGNSATFRVNAAGGAFDAGTTHSATGTIDDPINEAT